MMNSNPRGGHSERNSLVHKTLTLRIVLRRGRDQLAGRICPPGGPSPPGPGPWHRGSGRRGISRGSPTWTSPSARSIGTRKPGPGVLSGLPSQPNSHEEQPADPQPHRNQHGGEGFGGFASECDPFPPPVNFQDWVGMECRKPPKRRAAVQEVWRASEKAAESPTKSPPPPLPQGGRPPLSRMQRRTLWLLRRHLRGVISQLRGDYEGTIPRL